MREAGLETCVGGILNLGETREQRVEMAFELAAIDPTSVPINLLNPRPGTKFGDREFMDPWEAVKWIAIFRLILPEALFRLCGGRVENLGELQPLAVKAGLNGVMMGNFLTTLGNEPEDGPRDVRGARPERRAPARQRRQPAARQPLGLAGGRDARRGRGAARRRRAAGDAGRRSSVRLWDPSTQLRFTAKRARPAAPGRRAEHGARSAERAARR